MNDNLKNIIVSLIFIILIVGMFAINILKEDTEVSVSERRKLEQFPEFTFANLTSGKFFEKFDKYVTDQFIERETFRKTKVLVEKDLFGKKDYNNIYVKDGVLIEQTYPLNEQSVISLTKKINNIKEKYLTANNKTYYTIVPDKNYFVNGDNMRLDYKKLKSLMQDGLSWAEYIDIFDDLDLDSYYITDSHWKQEKLQKVVQKIAEKMDMNLSNEYEEKKIIDFKGVYAGQYPIQTSGDTLRILTNKILEECTVYNYEKNVQTKIYDMNKLNAYDKYDMFLSGAAALLKIENPNATTNKELIIFRDSYGSSLTPLLVQNYSTVTVVDTRYISPKILGKYIEFNNQDVLFEYSVLLINNSSTVQ